MEPTKIYKSDSKELINIVQEFCRTVYSTMGPGGKNVIIDTGEAVPLVTKDGVTVAESISFADPYKNSIASLIKETARKTGSEVGDGTTTSTLLTEKLITHGINTLALPGINHYEFFEVLDEAVMLVTDYLSDSIVGVENNTSLLEAIVKISTNSDEAITKLIMEAVEAAGADGIINVNKSDSQISTITTSNGASITSKVYTEKSIDALEMAMVLVEGPITDVNQVVEILRFSQHTGKAVILVAKEFDSRVLKILQANRYQMKATVIAVEAEGFGSNRLDILETMSKLLNCVLYSTEQSTSVDITQFRPDDVPIVYNVNISQNEVVFTPEEQMDIETKEKLINELKTAYNLAKRSPNSAESIHLKRKLSKFSKIATINVGGTTEGEVAEREARVTDAVCAVSAAINGGVLPGGGRALQCASKILEVAAGNENCSETRRQALMVLHTACNSPIETLCENVGINWSDYKDRIEFEDENVTLDLITLAVVNAFDSGILDPALVAINAVRNSASVAKTILRSNYVIIPDGPV